MRSSVDYQPDPASQRLREGVRTSATWVADSTPVECGRSRETAKRSDLAGWAEYGYCASRPRFFRGLRLHLVATLHGLQLGWALTGAKADERVVCWDMLTGTPALSVDPEGHQTLIADKCHNVAVFEADLNQIGITLLRPTRGGEALRAGERFFTPLRQCWRLRPSRSTRPGVNRRDLAQRRDRGTRPTLADRVRPLTPWNHSSRLMHS